LLAFTLYRRFLLPRLSKPRNDPNINPRLYQVALMRMTQSQLYVGWGKTVNNSLID